MLLMFKYQIKLFFCISLDLYRSLAIYTYFSAYVGSVCNTLEIIHVIDELYHYDGSPETMYLVLICTMTVSDY